MLWLLRHFKVAGDNQSWQDGCVAFKHLYRFACVFVVVLAVGRDMHLIPWSSCGVQGASVWALAQLCRALVKKPIDRQLVMRRMQTANTNEFLQYCQVHIFSQGLAVYLRLFW